MKLYALVPVKSLSQAKSRLADYLPLRRRQALVLEMLEHVLQTLYESAAFAQIYVVSPDPDVLELAQHWFAEPLLETSAGHNPALGAAARQILSRIAWHKHADIADTSLLTISADLPLLAVEDIQALVLAGEHSQVVLAASNDGTGTNALLTHPPLVLPYLFGPDSLPTYIQAAQEYALSYQRLSRPNLGWDIDIPADVQQLERVGWSHQLV